MKPADYLSLSLVPGGRLFGRVADHITAAKNVDTLEPQNTVMIDTEIPLIWYSISPIGKVLIGARWLLVK